MPMTRALRAVALPVLLTIITASARADVTIAVPSGWAPSTSAISVGGRLVVCLATTAAARPTRVMQWQAGSSVATDIPGNVFSISELASGGRLLVGYMPFGGAEEQPAYAVVSATGAILWSASMAGAVPSLTGDSVSALKHLSNGHSQVSTYAAATGALVARFESTETLRSAVATSDGQRVIVAVGMSVSCFDLTGGVHRVWSYDLPSTSYAPLNIRRLTANRVIVEQEWGEFTVLSDSGTFIRTWDPMQLDDADPSHDWQYFAQFEPYTSSAADRLYMFNGNDSVRAWDLTTGALTTVNVSLTPPTGFRRLFPVVNGQLVFFGATSVTLRSLPAP